MFPSYIQKPGLLIAVSQEELEVQTSGCWPDSGPYLPTMLTLGALNSQARVTDALYRR